MVNEIIIEKNLFVVIVIRMIQSIHKFAHVQKL